MVKKDPLAMTFRVGGIGKSSMLMLLFIYSLYLLRKHCI